jgi:hypothetical protein
MANAQPRKKNLRVVPADPQKHNGWPVPSDFDSEQRMTFSNLADEVKGLRGAVTASDLITLEHLCRALDEERNARMAASMALEDRDPGLFSTLTNSAGRSRRAVAACFADLGLRSRDLGLKRLKQINAENGNGPQGTRWGDLLRNPTRNMRK